MSLKDFLTYQAKTSPNPIGLEVIKAKGSYVYDSNGKKYLMESKNYLNGQLLNFQTFE